MEGLDAKKPQPQRRARNKKGDDDTDSKKPLEPARICDDVYVCDVRVEIEGLESPQRAIQSLLKRRRRIRYFEALHIVKQGYDESEELYPGFHADLCALRALGVAIRWHSEFDARTVAPRRAVISVPPDALIRDSGMTVLYKQMLAFPTYEQHAVSTSLRLDAAADWRNPVHWWNVVGYGFLLVIAYLGAQRELAMQILTVVRGRLVALDFQFG